MTRTRTYLFGLIALLLASPAWAFTIKIDYSQSRSGFFDPNTANGIKARAAVEKAASDISMVITDSLAGIDASSFTGSGPSTTYSINVSLSYRDPDTGALVQIDQPRLLPNEFRIYVGARSLSGNTTGQGGEGGAGYSSSGSGQSQGLLAAVAAAESAANLEFKRGSSIVTSTLNGSSTLGAVTANFTLKIAPTIGAMFFDNDGSTIWHYDHTTPVSSSATDLYSVAVHELIHTLGVGSGSLWDANVVGSAWTGNEVRQLVGSDVDRFVSSDGKHISPSFTGKAIVNGVITDIEQRSIMTNTILAGTREYLTTIDLAVLRDMGFSTILTPSNPPGGGGKPVNDLFANRIKLTGFSFSDTGDNINATVESGEPVHGVVAGPFHSVWWEWVAPADGVAMIDTVGSNFDTLLAIYTGQRVGGLSLIAKNAVTSETVLASVVSFDVLKGEIYHIAVDGVAGAAGFVSINLEMTSFGENGEFIVNSATPEFALEDLEGTGIDRLTAGGNGVVLNLTPSQSSLHIVEGNIGDGILAYGRVLNGVFSEEGRFEIFGFTGINGGDGEDYLVGTTGDDILRGGGGNDVLIGSDGDDQLSGDSGDDRISGGAGNDLIYGGWDADQIWGGSGDDRIHAGGGADMLYGGWGDDEIYGDFGGDLINGGDGNDYIDGRDGNDMIIGGLGDDVLTGGGGNDSIQGNEGNDTGFGFRWEMISGIEQVFE